MGGAACFSGFRALKDRVVTYRVRCIPETRQVRHHHCEKQDCEKQAWRNLLRDKNDRTFQSDDYVGDKREDSV
jgi:hypothetical protein